MPADDPTVLDGFLDEETVPGDPHGSTARFRLIVSPTDDLADEMTLPCSVADPELAHAVIHDLVPGDQLRVTGHLRLPRTPHEPIRLHVDTLEVLATSLLRARADDSGTDDLPDPTGLPARRRSTLPDDGLLERHGPYIAYLDPETAMTSVWTGTGAWVGTATYPDTSTDLIDVYERRTTGGEI